MNNKSGITCADCGASMEEGMRNCPECGSEHKKLGLALKADVYMAQSVKVGAIVLSKKAAKVLNKMDKPTQQRVRAGIAGLTKVPPEGDIKAMQGHTDGRQRLRIGKYRIVYILTVEADSQELYIMDIGSRGDIYK